MDEQGRSAARQTRELLDLQAAVLCAGTRVSEREDRGAAAEDELRESERVGRNRGECAEAGRRGRAGREREEAAERGGRVGRVRAAGHHSVVHATVREYATHHRKYAGHTAEIWADSGHAIAEAQAGSGHGIGEAWNGCTDLRCETEDVESWRESCRLCHRSDERQSQRWWSTNTRDGGGEGWTLHSNRCTALESCIADGILS